MAVSQGSRCHDNKWMQCISQTSVAGRQALACQLWLAMQGHRLQKPCQLTESSFNGENVDRQSLHRNIFLGRLPWHKEFSCHVRDAHVT